MTVTAFKLIPTRIFILFCKGPYDKVWYRLTSFEFEPGNVRSRSEAQQRIEKSRAGWSRQEDFTDNQFKIEEN